MKGNPVIWFEIYVQEMSRAKKFYESVFEVALNRLDTATLEMWAFPMTSHEIGASGALVKMDGVPSGGPGTIVYFHSPDCAVEVSRVVDAGGMIFKSPMSIGRYGTIALAIDTEGNMFGIHTPPAASE